MKYLMLFAFIATSLISGCALKKKDGGGDPVIVSDPVFIVSKVEGPESLLIGESADFKISILNVGGDYIGKMCYFIAYDPALVASPGVEMSGQGYNFPASFQLNHDETKIINLNFYFQDKGIGGYRQRFIFQPSMGDFKFNLEPNKYKFIFQVDVLPNSSG